MAEKNKTNPILEQRKNIARQILENKKRDEASIVSVMYKNPDLLRETNLTINDFHNNDWRVYFEILRALVIDEGKEVVNDIEVGLYLNQHPKLKKEYYDNGGYDTIEELMEYSEEENLDSYLAGLRKWNTVIKLFERGFPMDDERLKEICDMSVDDLYTEYVVYLNDIFANVENNVNSYNGFDGMTELIDELDEGKAVGIPFANCDVLNSETGGMLGGNIIGLGGSSGTGKSTLSINYIFPSMIAYDLRAVFIINEEDETKFKKEALVWYCNNEMKRKLKKPITKRTLRDGHFDEETKEALYEAARWFEGMKDNHNITIIPLEQYTAKTVVKLLKKYSNIGCDVIVIDTLKESFDARGQESWKSLMTDCVDFYDVIKHTDTCLVITYQLVKNKSRYLSNADIGISKGILDVFSVNLFFRRPMQDELEGEKNKLYCYRTEGNTVLPFSLGKDKHYMICFVSKNRFGQSDIQIVSEADFSVNKYEDLGYCVVPQDF